MSKMGVVVTLLIFTILISGCINTPVKQSTPTKIISPTITPTANPLVKDPIIGRWGAGITSNHLSFEFKENNDFIYYIKGEYNQSSTWEKLNSTYYTISGTDILFVFTEPDNRLMLVMSGNNITFITREDLLPLSIFKEASTPTLTVLPNNIKLPEGYTIYNPNDYDYINWEYAIAAYTNAWYNQDWAEMSKNTLPSWRYSRVKVPPEDVMKTMFEFKNLIGIKVISASKIDDRTMKVTVKTLYSIPLDQSYCEQTLIATLKRENSWGEPGGTSGVGIDRYYVDPFFDWDQAHEIN